MSNSTLSPSSDQNKPANYSTGWIPEPETRGTWGLLYSCIFTLSLCVYSAIHINVPARGESGNTRFWRKVKWVIIAIFAPEIALYSAWQQYYIANNFRYHFYNIKREQAGLPPLWNEPWWWRIIDFIAFMFHIITKPSVEEANSTNTVPAPKKFSLTYAFYVVMGGLVVNVDDIYDNVSRATLTPTGVLNLAKRTSCGRFFVPDETIRDKSKADNLAKVLVIFQV
ncbi:hypothetical protein H2200_012569 [Cladophialophora chaetospira]|uniref:Uncharacterized protein n=1 Tax=Cladophialophora chaetospira TaxID=386627 RepID=A0AA38WX76_9EURO|nr:hypothetical protein H2200_012569 [Cladophialophora chaetospira]